MSLVLGHLLLRKSYDFAETGFALGHVSLVLVLSWSLEENSWWPSWRQKDACQRGLLVSTGPMLQSESLVVQHPRHEPLSSWVGVGSGAQEHPAGAPSLPEAPKSWGVPGRPGRAEPRAHVHSAGSGPT